MDFAVRGYLFHLLLVVVLSCSGANSQTTEKAEEDRQKCVQEFFEWCRDNEYPTGESGVSILSVSFFDRGQMARIFCCVDSSGTDCMKNRSPWYHCYPNKTLEYKGEQLTVNSEGDDEICSTKDSALQFGKQVQFNSTLFEKEFREGMQRFYENMADLHKQMEYLNKRFSLGGFPFVRPDRRFLGNSSDENEDDSDPFNDVIF